jgi:hypothetical protein
MRLAQSTSEFSQFPFQGSFASTVGSSIIVLANILNIPANAAQIQQSTSSPIILKGNTLDTQRSSTVKTGLFQKDVFTLISSAASAAIGPNGLTRLENFFGLEAGWDGRGSKPIDLNSVIAFSRFFDTTSLCPEKLGVFMSAQGNVVVNWLDQEDQLIELEFHSSSIEYFLERSALEGSVSHGDAELIRLLNQNPSTYKSDVKG